MTQQTAAAKFCKDCRHYIPAVGMGDPLTQAEFARCAVFPSVESVRLNRIDGRPIKQLYCEIARDSDRCGPEAKRFEPAQTTEAA